MTRSRTAELAEAAHARADECLDLLRALVESESPSGDPDANAVVAATLQEAMERAGGRVERVAAPGFGEHLVGRFPGRRKDKRPLLVVGHMDTVHPAGTLESFPFAVESGRVQGPGVYDMKGGLAVALSALRLLAAGDSGPETDVSFLITCDEEVGSPHSKAVVEAEARASGLALVLEPSAPGGAVKDRRKGVGAYSLRVEGRPAHAGIEPEKGASAVHEIARQIGAIADLADPRAGTTVGVGTVRGGTAENVVAAFAECTVDVRFWTAAEARRVDRALRGVVAQDRRCSVTVEGGVNRGPLERTEASAAIYRTARAAAEEVGFALGRAATGGASDGNLAAAVGCPTLDGLGPDGGGAHTLDEHVLAADLPRRVALMASLFRTL